MESGDAQPLRRIFLDGREFPSGRQTGIGRYLAALAVYSRTASIPWSVATVSPPGFDALEGIPRRVIGRRDSILWDMVQLPRFLSRGGASAYVTPYVKYWPFPPCPVIAVICDPTDLLPDASTRSGIARLALRELRRGLIRRAAACITISDWSRRELSRILSLPWEIFRVIPPGISLPPPPPPDGAPKTILHVSNGKPHKNIARLLDAYAALPAGLRAAHPLCLAGIHERMIPAVRGAVEARGMRGLVRVDGHVDDHRLLELYASAAVFAFPSLVEGFGIPPLEAMMCGIPVVASTGGALRETLEDAACLVDPLDVAALRDALIAVLTNPDLRHALVQRGRARATQFPSARTGAALGAVIDEVLARSQPRT